MTYRWIITKDRCDGDAEGNSKGVEGPRGLDKTLKTNPAHFSLWDDDGDCMAEGMIYGDYDGFEPLDDWGMANWGCTGIKYGGEYL